MKMADVKIGMRLYDPNRPFAPVITVTEITADGFCYKHEPVSQKIGYKDGMPYFGIMDGGEHYGYGGECWYELLQ